MGEVDAPLLINFDFVVKTLSGLDSTRLRFNASHEPTCLPIFSRCRFDSPATRRGAKAPVEPRLTFRWRIVKDAW